MSNQSSKEARAHSKATSHGLFHAIFNIIQFSGSNINKIYLSALLRTIERIVELVPLLVFYSWLMLTLTGEQYLIARLFNLQSLTVLTLLLVLVFVLQFTLAYRGQNLGFSASYNITKSYRSKLYNHIYHLPLSTLYKQPVGQLAELLTDDIDKIETIFTHLLSEVIACIGISCVLIIVLFGVDWQLTLALISGLPVAFFVLYYGRKTFMLVGQTKQKLIRDTSGKIVEFCLGLTTLKLFNQSPLWLNKFKQQLSQINQAGVKVEIYGAGPVVLYRLIIELGIVLLLMVCTYQLNNQLFSLATTLLILLLASKVIAPLSELSEHLTILRYVVQSEKKLTQLTKQEAIIEPENAVMPKNNSIEFTNVCLHYNGKKVLNNISFTAKSSTITAIVGRSGMGKSSILNLLARFSQPSSGAITVGEQNINAIGSDNLYKHTSMVFQQVQLFAGTIINNVRIGNPKASDEQVISACKKAYCDDFIKKLVNGYHTQIGENGVRLSGGQRQRLSIARAFLKDADILLLDEATASIDPNSQYHIQQALSQLIKGKTLIMVAHRLTTIKHAEQILVVDEGIIIERGTHENLIEQQGLYQQLWKEERGETKNV